MKTSKSVWDYLASARGRRSLLASTRERLSSMLIGLGIIGFLLMGFILKFPLVLTLILALFFGAWGLAAALLEFVVKAVAKSRAPINIRSREPYEIFRYSGGWINLVLVCEVELQSDGAIDVVFTHGGYVTLNGIDAEQFCAFLNEIATPLFAFGAPTTETADAGQAQNWPEEE